MSLYTPPKPFQPFQPRIPARIDNTNNQVVHEAQKPAEPSETQMPRVIQYLADLSGCGLYRMHFPSSLLNFSNKIMVSDSNVMHLDPRYFAGVKAVRLQRQASTHQVEFVKFLKEIQKQNGMKIIYEVDDVVFSECIPDYNKFKTAFTDPQIRKNVIDIISLCDEVSVTCQYMKDLYREKTGFNNITVIPNFPTRYWIGNHFDPNRINQLYDKNKKRPRILYSGSGCHFDVTGRAGFDDFTHVIKNIIETRHKYQWVFIGAFPLQLQPYIQNGDIEYHEWQTLFNYPKKIHDLGVQMMVAPLHDNPFNNSKSDLKYIEACAYGLPVACQDIETYKDAEIKFRTGDEMIKAIDNELSRAGHYKNSTYKRYKVAEARFLENPENLACYEELFLFPYGDPRRVNLKRYNP